MLAKKKCNIAVCEKQLERAYFNQKNYYIVLHYYMYYILYYYMIISRWIVWHDIKQIQKKITNNSIFERNLGQHTLSQIFFWEFGTTPGSLPPDPVLMGDSTPKVSDGDSIPRSVTFEDPRGLEAYKWCTRWSGTWNKIETATADPKQPWPRRFRVHQRRLFLDSKLVISEALQG